MVVTVAAVWYDNESSEYPMPLLVELNCADKPTKTDLLASALKWAMNDIDRNGHSKQALTARWNQRDHRTPDILITNNDNLYWLITIPDGIRTACAV